MKTKRSRNYSFGLLLIAMIAITSCVTTKKEYHKNGNLSSISFFNKKSEIPFLIERYSEEGKKTSQVYYDTKGNCKGICFEINSFGDSIVKDYSKYPKYIEERSFLTNGEIYQTMYSDSLEHGIGRHFKNNRISMKGLFFKGQLLAYESYDYNLSKFTKLFSAEQSTGEKSDSIVFSNDNIEYVGTQYRISGDGTDYHTVGNYFFRSDSNSLDNRYSTYFLLETSDTLSVKDSIEVNVFGNYRSVENICYELFLSEVDSFDALSGKSNLKVYPDKVCQMATIMLPPQEPGYHFLVGSVFINLPNNSRKQQYIVFDDFVVK